MDLGNLNNAKLYLIQIYEVDSKNLYLILNAQSYETHVYE